MKYQKGFSPLVIILLVVLGIGVVGGGYVLYKDKQQQKKLETQIQDLQNQPVGDTTDITVPKVADKNPSSATEKLVITFPTTGSRLVEGEKSTITWTGVDKSAATYAVYLYKENSGSLSVSESNVPTSKNSISWTVPYLKNFGGGDPGERVVLPGNDFRIEIITIGTTPENMKKYYSPTFSIVAPENPTLSLPVQAGLPPVVEAKRQAIYKAAMERDYEKLITEADGEQQVLKSLTQDKKDQVLKVIPLILRASYLQNDYPDQNYTSYHWPASLERALTDEERENVRSAGDPFGASGYTTIIDKNGKWISFGYDI